VEEADAMSRKVALAIGVVAAAANLAFVAVPGDAGTAALARTGGEQVPAANGESPPLAALPPGAGFPQAFAFDPRRPNIVYVASPHGPDRVYVYKTTDNGQHWHVTGARGTGWVSDILSLTADPRHPGTLYAGTNTAVYKTVDGGRNWRPFNQGLFFPPHGGFFGTPGTTSWNRGNGWVVDVAVDPIHSKVVYAAAGGVRKSADGGHTWKAVFVPPGKYSGVSRIAIPPTRPESIYAIAHNLNDAMVGDTAIYKSTDTGRTWQRVGGGSSLPSSCCWDALDALAVDAGTPQTLYAVVGNTVFATTDGGASWNPMMNGLPANDVTSLAADPRRAGTIYASVFDKLNEVNRNAVHGAIYKTTDAGQTWSKVFSGFGVVRIAVDPKRPSTIYAAGSAGSDRTHHEPRLLRSTDSGRTWTVGG
jgi:photosystem II stability/assembly factor-like uncharacterized protein